MSAPSTIRRLYAVSAFTASATYKTPSDNQDSARAFCISTDSAGVGVALCDGVGAHPASGEVAEYVSELAGEEVARLGVRDGIASAANLACVELNGLDFGATTLIAIAATTCGVVDYGLIGNGSIFEIQVDLSGGTRRLSTAELTLPHVSFSRGRPALSSYLPMRDAREVEITAGSRHLHSARTSIFLACSDGIATDEERAVGLTTDGSTWRLTPRPLAIVLAALADNWEQALVSSDPGLHLEAVLQQSLDALAAELDDDATIAGVLVTPTSDTLE